METIEKWLNPYDNYKTHPDVERDCYRLTYLLKYIINSLKGYTFGRVCKENPDFAKIVRLNKLADEATELDHEDGLFFDAKRMDDAIKKYGPILRDLDNI